MGIYSKLLIFSICAGLLLCSTGYAEYLPKERSQYITEEYSVLNSTGEELAPSEGALFNDNEMAYRAAAHLALGEAEKAMEVYEEELLKHPYDPWLLCSIGDIYVEYLNDPDQAIDYYERAYQYSPSDPNAIIGKAKQFFINGNAEEGIGILRDFIAECNFGDQRKRNFGYNAAWMVVNVSYQMEAYEDLKWVVEAIMTAKEANNYEPALIQLYSLQSIIAFEYSQGNTREMKKHLELYKNKMEYMSIDKSEIEELLRVKYDDQLFGFCNSLVNQVIE